MSHILLFLLAKSLAHTATKFKTLSTYTAYTAHTFSENSLSRFSAAHLYTFHNMFQKLLRDLFLATFYSIVYYFKEITSLFAFFFYLFMMIQHSEMFCMESFKECSGRPKENKTFFVATKQKNKRTSVLFCLFIPKNELSVF